jgi:hypothetical protein
MLVVLQAIADKDLSAVALRRQISYSKRGMRHAMLVVHCDKVTKEVSVSEIFFYL